MAILSLSTLLGALQLFSTVVNSAPVATPYANVSRVADSSYWLAQIPKQGKAAFGRSDYTVFRNVKDFGARGDGT